MRETTMGLSTLEALLGERHSCRAFLPHGVPEHVINSMLAAAQRTASWCNTQPWQLHLTSGAGTDRFRRAMQEAARTQTGASDIPFPSDYRGAHLARRRASGFQLYEAMGVPRGDRTASAALALRNFDFFGAPNVLVLTTCRELGPYALLDCGGWIANFLLIAQAHGVGAVPQAALARHSDMVRASLDLPSDALVVCGISFGYADAGHPANSYRTARASLGEVVRRIDL